MFCPLISTFTYLWPIYIFSGSVCHILLRPNRQTDLGNILDSFISGKFLIQFSTSRKVSKPKCGQKNLLCATNKDPRKSSFRASRAKAFFCSRYCLRRVYRCSCPIEAGPGGYTLLQLRDNLNHIFLHCYITKKEEFLSRSVVGILPHLLCI